MLVRLRSDDIIRLRLLRLQSSSHFSPSAGSNASRSVYFPASSRTGLSRVSAAEPNRPITEEFDDDDQRVCVWFQLQSAEFSSSEKTPAGMTSHRYITCWRVTKYFYSSAACSYNCEEYFHEMINNDFLILSVFLQIFRYSLTLSRSLIINQ